MARVNRRARTPGDGFGVVDVLGARHSNGVFVDGTFGRGGHSREILALGPSGRLHGFDVDEDAIRAGKELRKTGLKVHRASIERPSRRCSSILERYSPRRSVRCGHLRTTRRRAGLGPRSRGRSTCASTPLIKARTSCSTSYELQDKEPLAALRPWRTSAHAGRIDAIALAKAEDPSLSSMTTSKLSPVGLGGKRP